MYALYKSMSTGKQKIQEDCYTSAQIYQKHSSRQYLLKSRKWNISGITRMTGIAVWIQADSKNTFQKVSQSRSEKYDSLKNLLQW